MIRPADRPAPYSSPNRYDDTPTNRSSAARDEYASRDNLRPGSSKDGYGSRDDLRSSRDDLRSSRDDLRGGGKEWTLDELYHRCVLDCLCGVHWIAMTQGPHLRSCLSHPGC